MNIGDTDSLDLDILKSEGIFRGNQLMSSNFLYNCYLNSDDIVNIPTSFFDIKWDIYVKDGLYFFYIDITPADYNGNLNLFFELDIKL